MAAPALYLLATSGCILITSLCLVSTISVASPCNVNAQTNAGWICGLRRRAENGAEYASFRGVPYAKQPLGELRFKELQPAEPWDYLMETVDEGPVCPQLNIFFGPMMQPRSMSEECIHANVHVPIHALPDQGTNQKTALPILVLIHGGGLSSGSGDSDMNGPEYLVGQDIILITFNYRLNVFGFLSLNSPSIPGNNGLRDQVTLLRWVQRNARAFGGNPDDITLIGQSAGATSAHILSLSNAAAGLFKRYIIMSGEADRFFSTALPQYSHDIAKRFFQIVGINSTDPDYIHNQLVNMPLEQIMNANEQLHSEMFGSIFTPVVEREFPGVTRILDDTPDALISQGRGADLPLLIGVTNKECETLQGRYLMVVPNILQRIGDDPKILLTPDMRYSLPIDRANEEAKAIQAKFLPNRTFDEFISYCTNSRFGHASLSLAQRRAELGSPAYMYEFAYGGLNSTVKNVLNASFEGAGHIEDLTYVFRTNSILGSRVSIPPQNDDDRMVILMSTIIRNFVYCSDPTCGGSDGTSWPLSEGDDLMYHYIESPSSHYSRPLTTDQKENVLEFFNDIYDSLSGPYNVSYKDDIPIQI